MASLNGKLFKAEVKMEPKWGRGIESIASSGVGVEIGVMGGVTSA